MTPPRWPIQWSSPAGPGRRAGRDTALPPPAPDLPSPDLTRLLRELERKKRLAARLPKTQSQKGLRRDLPFPGYFERATCVSFRLDGLQATQGEVSAALARGAAARACRSRAAQRVRNHVAALRHVESLLRRGHALHAAQVIRWYTSVACGLSCGRIDDHTARRLDHVVSTVNSPQLGLWPAVREITALHVRLLADPFVPGFNGILARLLLRYHLGRCGLPPVLFDPAADGPRLGDPATFLPRLLELIDEGYDRLGRGTGS